MPSNYEFNSGLMPDPRLTVSEWADAYRQLSSKASAEPGKWKTSRTPYLKEIMDCLSPTSPVERIAFMKGAQVGGTECGNNWIGFVIHHSPGPMITVLPTVDMAERTSKQRIAPLIDATPELAALVNPARSRDSGNTLLSKEFRGGILIMTGANSATGLRSMPARYIFMDEVDAYPGDVDGEGDPVGLAEARARTFARRKIFMVSTPKVSGSSRIEREYESSDRRRYFVPCPHCGHKQYLEFEHLRWDKGNPASVYYECIECQGQILEHHKTQLFLDGEWIPTSEAVDGKTRGYHISGLYSPVGWLSWEQIARDWESAQGSIESIKRFKNTVLGEAWVERGDVPQWESIFQRSEDYIKAPFGVLFLSAGVDIQKDRIEVTVWGWGRRRQKWRIEHKIFHGDTSRETVWSDLSEYLDSDFEHQSGASLRLSKIAIDTGYATEIVYRYIRVKRDSRIIAIKGVQRGSSLVGLPRAVGGTKSGKKARHGIKLYLVTGPMAKEEFYSDLQKIIDVTEDGEIAYPTGYVHFNKDDDEFFKQICSEQLVTRKNRNGYQVTEWQKIRDRNEALDCFVYARAAASVYGIDRFSERHFSEIESQIGESNSESNLSTTPESTATKLARKRPRATRSTYM